MAAPLLSRLFLGFLALLFLSFPACAQDAFTRVRVVSPSWESFTNSDGTGLYFDLLNAVFTERHEITVEHHFVPSLRATHLVRENEADMMVCKARIDPPLLMARMPMYENAYSVFFSREAIGEWHGRDSLVNRSVVWRIGYYDERYLPQGMQTKEVKSGTSALGMVVLGRADFYLDDPVLIKESISKSGLSLDLDKFRIEPVGFRSYHPVFNQTERGLALMDLYDKGMLDLHKQGLLAPIYKKWGHPYPRFDQYE